MGFTYNSMHSDDMGLTVRSSPSILPPLETQMQSVPGRPGAYYRKSRRKARPIPKDVGFIADDFRDYHQRLRDLAAWLMPGEEAAPLVDDDEPDKTYYVVLDGSTDLKRLARVGQGTLLFVAPDPDAVGAERTQTINDPAQPNLSNVIDNPGTAETPPLFRVNIEKAATFLAIANGEEYVQIGQPTSVEETQVEKEELMLHDALTSTTGYTIGTYVDGGVVDGTMESNGHEFIATAYGTGTNWHGPALVKALSTQLTDFMVETRLTLNSQFNRQVGRAEIYLLGPNNEVIGKMALKDIWHDRELNHIQMRVGNLSNHHSIYNLPDSAWEDFGNGLLRISRKENVWTAYIAQVDPNTGRHYATLGPKSWTDQSGIAAADLASVQLHIGAVGSYSKPSLSINDLKVFRLNDVQQEQVPYIVRAGDSLEINHKYGKVYRNGEMIEYDIDSDFFKLLPGQNVLGVAPADIGPVEAVYRPRYL